MKSITIAAVLLAGIGSVAHADEIFGTVRDSYAQMPPTHKSMQMSSLDVLVDGQIVGRDPSPSVRQALANEYYSLRAETGDGGGGNAGGDAGGASQ